MKSEELIERIVEEKGEEAIPILKSLLIEYDDEKLIKLIIETLDKLGKAGKEEIYKVFSELCRNKNELNNPKIYYLIDSLANNDDRRIIPDLMSILKKTKYEETNLLIYDALAMLGEGEKVVDVLTVMSEEEFDQDSWEILIMALSHTKSVKAFLKLKEMYNDQKDENRKIMILEGMINILNEREELIPQLNNDESGREILKKINLWLKNNEKNFQ
ncbi:MAG: hypothetical protein PWQ77_1171 [Kosmotogales bacterium]|nr:hypothetical protein [Kosmotogales bacterium]